MQRLLPSIFALLLWTNNSAEAALRIVAATNDLGALARAVGGELVEIDVVARPDRDPHTLEVRPSTMRKTAKADIYLEVGLSLDPWSADIVRGSRNRNVRVIDCSTAIAASEVPAGRVDASMGDVHPEGNPHYWLDPENGVAVANLLAEQFSHAAPENEATFRQNAATFAKAVSDRMPGWEQRLKGGSFVEFHRTWVYLAERFEMTIVGEVEPLPGIPPTARHLADLSRTIREKRPSVIVRDYFHSESPLEFLERETSTKAMVLSSVCAEPTPESYLAHFDRIAEVLGSGPREKPR